MANKLIDKINDGTNKWWLDKGLVALGNYWDSPGSYTYNTSTHTLVVHINCTYDGPDISNNSILSVYLPELADIDGSFTPSSTSYIVDRYLFLDVYLGGNVPGSSSTPDFIASVDISMNPYHQEFNDYTGYYELAGLSGNVLVGYEEYSDTVEGVSVDGFADPVINIGSPEDDISIPSLWTASDLHYISRYVTSGMGVTSTDNTFDITMSNYQGNQLRQLFTFVVSSSKSIYPTIEINTLRSSGLANNRITVQRSNTTLDGVVSPSTIPAGVYLGSLSAWSNSATLTIKSFKTDATQVQIVRW